MTEDDKEIAEIAREFGSKYRLAQEIMKLRKNQMPEKIPKVIPVFITFTPEGGCYNLSLLEPKDRTDYIIAYQPLDEE